MLNNIRMCVVNMLIAIIFLYWAVLYATLFFVALPFHWLQKLSMKLLPQDGGRFD